MGKVKKKENNRKKVEEKIAKYKINFKTIEKKRY